MNNYHQPVLRETSVKALITAKDGVYVDATFGGGGHSNYILQNISQKGKLIAFDQDPDCEKNIIKDDRFQFNPQNFKYLKKFLQYNKQYPVEGILADLGVSSHQFDTASRGFSYRFDGELDMRMNPLKGISAFEVVNQYSETKLTNIFYTYGELPNARRIAKTIVEARTEKQIITTTDLVKLLTPIFPDNKQNKIFAQLFQALRIEVNSEMEALKEFLLQTIEALKSGGRLVIISYHSLEDRLVKNFMRSGNLNGNMEKDFYGNPLTPWRVLSSKVITPDENEITSNPRARSAKLRIAEKI